MNGRLVLATLGTLIATAMTAGCAQSAEPDQAASTTNAIIGGTTETGHAYVVGIGDDSRAFCTGTVLSKRTVLTAGHCFASGIKRVYFGLTVPTSGGATTSATSIAVATAVRHPGYALVNGLPTNDLTLVQLVADAPVQPAPLFRGTLENTSAFVGPDLTWVGYGDNVTTSGPAGVSTSGFGTKRVARFPIANVGPANVGGDFATIDATQFYYNVPGRSMCHGDSGGPAFLVENGVEALAGVTSFGDSGCATDGVQQRSDAPQIAAFIQQNLDTFENNDACRSDGTCNESCNTGGQVGDADCHAAHCGADGICAAACAADPDCAN